MLIISLQPSQVKEGASRPWERRTEHSLSVSKGSCPAGVQGFESPPPHHLTSPLHPIIPTEATVRIEWNSRTRFVDAEERLQ